MPDSEYGYKESGQPNGLCMCNVYTLCYDKGVTE